METLDQSTNNQISERAIRNLSSSSVWIIIVSSVGLIFSLWLLYNAFQLLSHPFASNQGGILLIISLVIAGLEIVGLNYGVSLTKLKIYTAEDFDKAMAKHNAYWIFCGIVWIVWFLFFLMGLSGGGFGRMF